ncbi:hypothetical protein V6N00_16615 [Tersicoccus sp. MR15.9]|uniref:hypothetical protein n=1 Tax=Tersicoccus mangrovi TaxID=3121635 RepID=UPI002FE62D00
MMRRAGAVAATVVAVAGTMLAAPAAANAADFEFDYAVAQSWQNGKAWCVNNPGIPTAVGCWESRGDVLQVGDLAADHRSVGMQWKTDYGRAGICVNTHGKDATITYAINQGKHLCNKNMAEGHDIWVRVGRCDFSAVNCRNLANWTSWSGWVRYRTSY